MMKLIITVILGTILIKLIFRKIIDLPKYKGKLFVDNSEIIDVMPETKFWELIKASSDNGKGNYTLQCRLLTEKLEGLTSKEIIEFDRTFVALMAKSYSFRLWEAAYALNGGCSDDCFEYFRSWLIAQGRNKFYWTIRFPRILFLVGVKELIENYEGVSYCAMEAYQNKTGSDIPRPDDIKYNDAGKFFSEVGSFIHYPELALLTW